MPYLISPYLNKCGMQSNNYGMPLYVSGDSDFKYTITWLLWHLLPPFLKMAVVNTNVPISQKLRHLEQLLTLLHSLVDSDIKYVFVTFNNITIHAIFKDGVCQSPLCPYLRNTVLRSIFHHILKDRKRLRFRVIHLIEFIQSNNFHIHSIF